MWLWQIHLRHCASFFFRTFSIHRFPMIHFSYSHPCLLLVWATGQSQVIDKNSFSFFWPQDKFFMILRLQTWSKIIIPSGRNFYYHPSTNILAVDPCYTYWTGSKRVITLNLRGKTAPFCRGGDTNSIYIFFKFDKWILKQSRFLTECFVGGSFLA